MAASAASLLAGVTAAELLDVIRDELAKARDEMLGEADLRDAFYKALHDARDLRRTNDMRIVTVAAGATESFNALDEFDAQVPALAFFVHESPGTGFNMRLNAGPVMTDVPANRAMDHHDIYEAELDNTAGASQAVVFFFAHVGGHAPRRR